MRLKKDPRGGAEPFDAASMKHKIKIMRKGAATQDQDNGDWAQGPATLLLETYASVTGLFGQEYWTARSVQAAKTVTFKVFFADAIADLSARDYIEWGGKIYDIQDPDNVQHDNVIIKIRAVVRT